MNRNMYYDRSGKPITLLEWGSMFEDRTTKRVAETTLPDGTWISTVWFGLDHRFGDGPPLIFETMVFPSKDGLLYELDTYRYSTEEEAIKGHEEAVAKWSAAQQEKEDE